MRRFLSSLVAVALCASTAQAVVQFDGVLSNTSQIRTAANSPFFGAGTTQDVAAINFFYAPGGDVSLAASVNGVKFDNINMVGAVPPAGPFVLTQNVVGIGYSQSMPFTLDNNERNINLSAIGTDSANLNAVANEIFYISTGGDHPTAQMTFSNLGANRNLYVQVIGGDAGWNGDLGVTANGSGVGTWTNVADVNPNNGSLFAFDTTSNASGQLQLDFTGVAGNFAGIGGIIISGQGILPPPPTPAFSQAALSNTAQVLGADASFGQGVAANFKYSNQSASVPGTVNGITFQDVDWLLAGGGPQALGGGVAVQVVPSFVDGTGRARAQNTAGTIFGAGETVLESVADTINFLNSGESEQFNFTGLHANRLSRIQIIGGDDGTGQGNWLGDLEVSVNGNVLGLWTAIADDNRLTPSIATLFAMTNNLGQLNITVRNISTGSPFAGIAAVVVSQAIVPEPATATMGLMALSGLLLRRRRTA